MAKTTYAIIVVATYVAALMGSCKPSATEGTHKADETTQVSSLIDAAKKGDISAAKRLLVAGHTPDESDAEGHTALQYAASSGNAALVRLLLDAKADVNARGADGYTALHAAATERHVDVVETLLKAGADLNARASGSVTPLVCSITSPYSDSSVAILLIRAGADVNIADTDGATALWYATTERSLDVMEEILKKGAQPDVQSKSLGFPGYTPLHMAVVNGLTKQVDLLLRYGANPAITNNRGEIPLDIADVKFVELRNILTKHDSNHPH